MLFRSGLRPLLRSPCALLRNGQRNRRRGPTRSRRRGTRADITLPCVKRDVRRHRDVLHRHAGWRAEPPGRRNASCKGAASRQRQADRLRPFRGIYRWRGHFHCKQLSQNQLPSQNCVLTNAARSCALPCTVVVEDVFNAQPAAKFSAPLQYSRTQRIPERIFLKQIRRLVVLKTASSASQS